MHAYDDKQRLHEMKLVQSRMLHSVYLAINKHPGLEFNMVQKEEKFFSNKGWGTLGRNANLVQFTQIHLKQGSIDAIVLHEQGGEQTGRTRGRREWRLRERGIEKS